MQELSKALLKAQKNMGDAVKGSTNPFFKSHYADLNAIREVAIPALNAVGITVLQPTKHLDGKNFVCTMLLHESGESLESLTEVIPTKQNDPQSFGAAITYARRFGLQSMCNVGAVDDDCESQYERKPKQDIAPTPKKDPLAATIITFGTAYKGLSFAAVGKTNLAAYRDTVLKKYPVAEKAPDEINEFLAAADRWLA